MDQLDYKLQLASDFENNKKYLHALQIYEPLLLNPDFERIATLRLSNIYEKLNKANKSINLLSSYCEAHPDDIILIKYFIHLLLRIHRYEEAIKYLSGTQKDKHPDFYFLNGYAHYHVAEFEIARINFDEFLKDNNESDLIGEAHHYLARIFRRIKLFDDAQKHIQIAEDLSVRDPDVYLTFAQIYYSKEMYLHAEEKIRKALSLNSENPGYIKWAGKIFYKMNEYEKAEYYFLNFLSSSVPDAELYSLLGFVCLKNNKKDDAVKYFNKALGIDPNSDLALKGLKQFS